MISLNELVKSPSTLTRGSTYRQVLERAVQRLVSPERWTQLAFARDRLRQGVKPKDPSACCWCLLGAVAFESNDHGIIPPPLLRFLEDMMRYVFGTKFATLGEMNDYIDHETLIDFLRKCVGRFEA